MTIQPSLREYAFLGDSMGAALVSSSGSIDWCCLKRMDQDACFARVLDAQGGGACTIEGVQADGRRYLDGTLVLETDLRGRCGRGRLLDLFDRSGSRRLVRVVEGIEGELQVAIRVAARFDYGTLRPWVRLRGRGVATLQGGDGAIVVSSDAELQLIGEYDLLVERTIRPGERLRLALAPTEPRLLDADVPAFDPCDLDSALESTVDWWRRQAGCLTVTEPQLVRSALILRALVFEPSGAIAAAATTSLPEAPGGDRNWDYRYSWIRDSTFTARSLARVGMPAIADDFARFVMRSAAGSADDIQVVYGLSGERHLPERELDLGGYRGARPVRVGNGATRQVQHDEMGELMQMCWRWHERGHVFDDDEWRFLTSVVERAASRWAEPDRGLWEWRPGPRHFVHSKAACWGALDRGLALAAEQGREAPVHRWRRTRDEIAQVIGEHGFDRRRGTFVQAFDDDAVDAAALLIPVTGYVEYGDRRMHTTVDAVREQLEDHGLVRRYRADDGFATEEGAFLPCSFWLAECLAHQDRVDEAAEVYARAIRAATPLGIFSEEADAQTDEPLGNMPQGLTHLSHITAALAIGEARRAPRHDLAASS